MTRRFSPVARGLALIGAAVGILAVLGSARAADATATGSIAPRREGSEWWRLRPTEAPTVAEATKAADKPPAEARKAVRIVYPAPYER